MTTIMINYHSWKQYDESERREISKKMENANVYVRHISGAKLSCVKDYLKQSLKNTQTTLYFTSAQMISISAQSTRFNCKINS